MKTISVKAIHDFISACGHIMKNDVMYYTIRFETNAIIIRNHYQSVSMQFDTGVCASVDYTKFKNLISSLDKKKEVYFERKDDKLLIYYNGKVVMKMVCDNKTEPLLFSQKFPKYHYSGLLKSADVEKVIEASTFISDDELRPAMLNVCVTQNMIYGTNAHWLYFNKHESNLTFPEIEEITTSDYSKKRSINESCREYPLLLPVDILKILKKSVKDYQVFIGWEMKEEELYGFSRKQKTISEMGLKLVSDGLSIITTMNFDKFPDCDSVIPNFKVVDQSDLEVEFKKSDVQEAIKICMISNKDRVVFDFVSSKGNTVFTGEDLDDGTQSMLEVKPEAIEVKIHNQSMISCDKIAFNPQYLNAIILQMKKENFKIRMFAPNRAGIIDDKFLIMPVMLEPHL